MTDLDEAGVKQQDVWRMESDTLCRAFPFYGFDGATGIAMLVVVEAKLCTEAMTEMLSTG